MLKSFVGKGFEVGESFKSMVLRTFFVLFRRLIWAKNKLLNDSSDKNRGIVQEYRETFNSMGIVHEFIYISFRGLFW